MNKKLTTATLCVLIIAIIAVTLSFFIKSVKNSLPSDTSQTDTTPPEDTTDVGDDTVTDPEPEPEPEDKTEENTKPEDEPETTDKVEQVPENNNTESNPDDKVESTPDTEEEVTKPVINNNSQVNMDYKSFSLLKGKSALESYEYLNEFLSSKYSILVNKQNKVGSSYEPSDLVVPSGCDYKMERVAADALVKMLNAAKSDGIYDLILCSGYRTYSSQKSKYETRTQKYLNQGYSQAEAEAKAGEYIAPPGASEHHTGLAADVCSYAIVAKYGYLSDDFDTTKEFKWLKENCAEYGFILRYTKEDEDITGYLYEPWHYRYIGVEHATACMELGVTYEEYYSMLVKFRDQAKADAGV